MIGIIWFRFKVLKVLKEDFNYKPAITGIQKEAFNAATRQMKKNGGNEYDAAIAFMLIQLDSLSETKETFDFRNDLVNNAVFASQKSKLPITSETATQLFELYEKQKPT